MLDDHEQQRLERIEKKIDLIIESIPPQCSRNDERIKSLERSRKGFWGIIGASVTGVVLAIINHFVG